MKKYTNRYDSAWFFLVHSLGYYCLPKASIKNILILIVIIMIIFLLTKAVNSSITNWIGDILAVVFLFFVHFLSFNEARIIFLLCCVALRASMCVCVCLPAEPVNAIWIFVYYLVVLISWMGTKKKRIPTLFLGNLWIFLLFFGLLTFSQWIGIIEWQSCNAVTHTCKRA